MTKLTFRLRRIPEFTNSGLTFDKLKSKNKVKAKFEQKHDYFKISDVIIFDAFFSEKDNLQSHQI